MIRRHALSGAAALLVAATPGRPQGVPFEDVVFR
jgi:hypothetical protein